MLNLPYSMHLKNHFDANTYRSLQQHNPYSNTEFFKSSKSLYLFSLLIIFIFLSYISTTDGIRIEGKQFYAYGAAASSDFNLAAVGDWRSIQPIINNSSFAGSVDTNDRNNTDQIKLKNYQFSVLDFGAVPNDGINDTEAFREAIKMTANNTKTMYIPAGIYDIDGRIRLPSNFTIEGQSQNNTIIVWHTNYYNKRALEEHVLHAEGTVDNHLTNITIKNLTIKGAGVDAMGNCIKLKWVTNYLINNTKLSGCGPRANGAAIFTSSTSDGRVMHNIIDKSRNGYLTPQSTGGSKDILIAYNQVSNSTDDAIHPQNGTNNKIIGNIVIDSGDDNIDIFHENNTLIENNTVIMNNNSKTVTGFEIGDGSTNILLKGNRVIGGASFGINIATHIKDSASLLNKNTNITISDNLISQTNNGCIRVTQAEDVQIIKNYLEACNTGNTTEGSGIRIDETATNTSLLNNFIEYYGIASSSGINIDNSHFVEIISNIIKVKVVSVEAFGIRLKSLTDNVLIRDNDLKMCGCVIRNESIANTIIIQQ
jgi:parallel beta-helix repeat protein